MRIWLNTFLSLSGLLAGVLLRVATTTEGYTSAPSSVKNQPAVTASRDDKAAWLPTTYETSSLDAIDRLQSLLKDGGPLDMREVRSLFRRGFSNDYAGTWKWLSTQKKVLPISSYNNLVQQAEYSQSPYLNPNYLNDVEQWQDPSGIGRQLQLEANAPGKLDKMEMDVKNGKLNSTYYEFIADIPLARDWSATVDFLDKQDIGNAQKSELIETAVDKWSQSADRDAAFVWLRDEENKPEYDRAYSAFIEQSASVNPDRVQTLFSRISDPSVKISTVYDLTARLGEDGAREMLITTKTSKNDKDLLEKVWTSMR